MHPDIDIALREEIEAVFLDIHQSEQGQAVLAPLMISQFIPPDDSSYDTVRQMAEDLRGSIAQTALKRRRGSIQTEADVENSTER